jgi:hypothetical protein
MSAPATATPVRLLICQAIEKRRLLTADCGLRIARHGQPERPLVRSPQSAIPSYAFTRIKNFDPPQNSSGEVTRRTPPTLLPVTVSGFTSSRLCRETILN